MLPANLKSQKNLEVITSKAFVKWLFEQKAGLVFTAYLTNKLFLIGVNPQGKLSVFERTFEKPTSLHLVGKDTMYMATAYQIWRFENVLKSGQLNNGYDGVYLPQVAWTTGAVDVKGIGKVKDGGCVFVNSRFSCLAKVSEKYSFEPIWKPYFISKLTPENKCHLSGMAIHNEEIEYVTAYAQTDNFEGWLDQFSQGGVILDYKSNTVVTKGLNMPNSPVLYKDKLYFLNSGTGELMMLDRKNGEYTPICFCHGFARGLAIKDNFAIISISKFRESKIELPVQRRVARDKTEVKAGILVVDLNSGNIVHTFAINGQVTEIFDVAFVDSIMCPSAIGIVNDDIKHTITIGDSHTF